MFNAIYLASSGRKITFGLYHVTAEGLFLLIFEEFLFVEKAIEAWWQDSSN